MNLFRSIAKWFGTKHIETARQPSLTTAHRARRTLLMEELVERIVPAGISLNAAGVVTIQGSSKAATLCVAC